MPAPCGVLGYRQWARESYNTHEHSFRFRHGAGRLSNYVLGTSRASYDTTFSQNTYGTQACTLRCAWIPAKSSGNLAATMRRWTKQRAVQGQTFLGGRSWPKRTLLSTNLAPGDRGPLACSLWRAWMLPMGSGELQHPRTQLSISARGRPTFKLCFGDIPSFFWHYFFAEHLWTTSMHTAEYLVTS